MKRNKKLLALVGAFLVVITFATGCSSTPGPGMSEDEQEEYLDDQKSYWEQQYDQRLQDYKDGKVTDEDLAAEREKNTLIGVAMCSGAFSRGFYGTVEAEMVADEENNTLTLKYEVEDDCDREKLTREAIKSMKRTLFYYGFTDTEVIVEFTN